MGKSRQTGKLSSDGMIFPSPSNGRVGIGTSVPSETLHIEGSARLTEELYDYNNIAGSSGQVLTSTGVGVSWSSEGVGGDEGAQGAQGTQATQGSQGFQGLQGLQGFQGTQGFQGNQGTQGLSNQGAQGSQGSQGTQGVKGDNGNFGGASFEYNFDSSETDADPGSGNIRLVRTSGADLTTSTQINIDDNSTNATDISSYLATIDASTSTIKGHLKITKIGDASAFIMYTISTESDQSGYHTITVSSVDNSGVNPFANGDQLLVTFARTGDKGDQGNQGDEGLQGNQGTQGVGSQGGQGLQGGGGQGTQGSQGFQGTQGIQGLSNQGAQGTQGTQGSQGFQGTQGTQGTQGKIGDQVIAKTYDFTADDNVYTIDGIDQDTLHLIRGQKYIFDGSSATSHPIRLSTDSGNSNSYTNGYTTGSNNTHTFVVPYDSPDDLYYYCGNHSGMGGAITVRDLTANDLQGTQGSQGLQGTYGSQGFQGVYGIKGDKGDDGTSVTIVGSIALTVGNTNSQNETELNSAFTSPTVGDGVLDSNTGNLWVYGGSSWTNVGNIRGPQGTQGLSNQGAQGTQGTQGIQGLFGAVGNQGNQGTQGSQGSQGFQGLFGGTGLQGAQGSQGFQGIQGLSNQGAQGTQGLQGSTATQFDGGVERTVTSVIVGSASTDTIDVNYTVGYLDVYLNGSKLDNSEYTATNGTSVIFIEDLIENDIIETISYERVSLGQIQANSKTAIYQLVLTDVGKFVNTDSNVKVPSNIFSEGDIISVYNNSSSSIVIQQNAGTTVYLGGVGSTGNRTLEQKGVATLLCVGSNLFVITGAGLL